jgi:prepilin-type N-terminal cleavage/methylation domain-containing protein
MTNDECRVTIETQIVGTPNRHSPFVIRHSRQRGLGLVELLVTLAITAALLSATAFAVNAAISAYSVNATQSDTLHRSRIALERISTYIRTSTAHAPYDSTLATNFAKGETVTDTGVSLFDTNDEELSFRLDAEKGQLLVTENGNEHVLLRGVEQFSISLEPMRSAASVKSGGGYDLLKRATITLTVSFANTEVGARATDAAETVTLSTAVVPRKNIW